MVNLKKIEVLKSSFFLGLFGIFSGAVTAFLQIFLWNLSLTLIFDDVVRGVMIPFFGFWFSIFLHPLIYGIVFFVGGLVFVPIMNLCLKILKGIDFHTGSDIIRKPTRLGRRF